MTNHTHTLCTRHTHTIMERLEHTGGGEGYPRGSENGRWGFWFCP